MTAETWNALAQAAAQPDYSGSCMLALYPSPDVASALALPDGLDPAEIHLTLAYCGDAADVDPGALQAAALALTSRQPVDAQISGHARFTGGEDGDVIVVLIDSPALDALRRDAESALEGQGIGLPSEHGFTAHMTLCYQDAADPDPVGRIGPSPVSFAGVSAVHGTQRTGYPFSAAAAEADPLAAYSSHQAAWSALAGAR